MIDTSKFIADRFEQIAYEADGDPLKLFLIHHDLSERGYYAFYRIQGTELFTAHMITDRAIWMCPDDKLLAMTVEFRAALIAKTGY